MDYRQAFVGLVVAYEEKAATHEVAHGSSCSSCGAWRREGDCCDNVCPTCQAWNFTEAEKLLEAWERVAGGSPAAREMRERFDRSGKRRDLRLASEANYASKRAERAAARLANAGKKTVVS